MGSNELDCHYNGNPDQYEVLNYDSRRSEKEGMIISPVKKGEHPGTEASLGQTGLKMERQREVYVNS